MLDPCPLFSVVNRVCIVSRDATCFIFELLCQDQIQEESKQPGDSEASPKSSLSDNTLLNETEL